MGLLGGDFDEGGLVCGGVGIDGLLEGLGEGEKGGVEGEDLEGEFGGLGF